MFGMASRAFGERGRRPRLGIIVHCGDIKPHEFAFIAHRHDCGTAVAPHEPQQTLFAESASCDVGEFVLVLHGPAYFGNAVMTFVVPVSNTMNTRLSGGCSRTAPNDRPEADASAHIDRVGTALTFGDWPEPACMHKFPRFINNGKRSFTSSIEDAVRAIAGRYIRRMTTDVLDP